MKYTYNIEYNISDKIMQKGYFSSNKGLKDGTVAENEDLFETFLSSKRFDIEEISSISKVKVLNTYENKFGSNKYLSDDIILLIQLFKYGIELSYSDELSKEDADIFRCNKEIKYQTLDIISNYLVENTDYPTIFQYNKIGSIKYCQKIVNEFQKTIYKKSIKQYDKMVNLEYPNFKDNTIEEAYFDLIETVFLDLRDIATYISNIIGNMTNLLGFKITLDNTFDNYFNSVIENLELKLKLETEEFSNKGLNQEIITPLSIHDKELILEKISPYKNRKTIIELLNNIDENFYITKGECSKLQLTAICLVLKECTLFNRNIGTFNKFKKDISLYYGQPNPSYKINDVNRELLDSIKNSFVFNNITFR